MSNDEEKKASALKANIAEIDRKAKGRRLTNSERGRKGTLQGQLNRILGIPPKSKRRRAGKKEDHAPSMNREVIKLLFERLENDLQSSLQRLRRELFPRG